MVHRVIREHRLDDLAAYARTPVSRTQIATMRFLSTLAANDPVIPVAERDSSACAATSGVIQERVKDISAS
ncbi:MAG TPA: hypothetical protein VLB83_00915 [Candidatus Paceibacterota bacterium]|nr:hypothetical protein [Candidatus Paceibacterota bacterium]